MFNNQLYSAHWSSTGDTLPGINVRADTLAMLASYGITDRVMVSACCRTSTPGIRGRRPTGGRTSLSMTARGTGTPPTFALACTTSCSKTVRLAPFIALVTPVTDYPTQGHAAPGRGLNELMLGFNVGKSLDPWIPRTYAQLRYSYAFVEEVQDVTTIAPT